MGLSKTLKMNAKRALAGNWGKAIGIMLLAMLPGILLNIFEFALRAVLGISEYMDYNNTPNIHIDDMASVYSVSLLVSFLILALTFVIIIPLSQGELRWYYRRTGGENDGVSSIFYYFETFKQYGKAFWLNLSISLRVFGWTLLLYLPLIVLVGFMGMYSARYDGELPAPVAGLGIILLIVWGIAVVIFSVAISLRYFLAPYILAENPQMKSREAVKQSVKYMKGHKGDVFVFGLSFIGWILLCVFFIPMFYVIPYMNASHAMYARYLIQLGNNAFGGGESTREYKVEIDRYMEDQGGWKTPAPSQQPPEQQGPEL